MKVSELPYQRVTIEQFQAVMRGVVDRIRRAGNVEEILAAREDYLGIMTAYMTASSLSYMRYSINTADEFYVAEKDYYDQIGPEAESACLDYANALLESPFRPELEQKLSPVLFRSLEVQKKSMSPEIVPDMVEENKIVTEYSRLMASMEFEFRGEKMPRSILMKYAKEEDRQTRRACYEVLGRTMAQYAEQLDDIYDRLTSGTGWPGRWATGISWSWATTGWAACAMTRPWSGCSGTTCSGISCPWWQGSKRKTPDVWGSRTGICSMTTG